MRKLLIGVPAAIALAVAPFEIPLAPIAVLVGIAPLAGCANGTTPSADVASVINSVIAGVQAACQVSPVAADVAQLIPIYGPSASAIITAICAAVKAAPLVAGGAAPGQVPPPVRVHGVLIHFQ